MPRTAKRRSTLNSDGTDEGEDPHFNIRSSAKMRSSCLMMAWWSLKRISAYCMSSSACSTSFMGIKLERRSMGIEYRRAGVLVVDQSTTTLGLNTQRPQIHGLIILGLYVFEYEVLGFTIVKHKHHYMEWTDPVQGHRVASGIRGKHERAAIRECQHP